MSLLAERYLDDEYSPAAVAERCGVPAEQIERLALEMASVAFQETIELPIAWTDVWGREHTKVVGRPVAMYAMRGISAHSNGFQTCRALHLIQMLLGALDDPEELPLTRAPFPKAIPPHQLPESDAPRHQRAGHGAAARAAGLPPAPEDLAIDEHGQPLRLDNGVLVGEPDRRATP